MSWGMFIGGNERGNWKISLAFAPGEKFHWTEWAQLLRYRNQELANIQEEVAIVAC